MEDGDEETGSRGCTDNDGPKGGRRTTIKRTDVRALRVTKGQRVKGRRQQREHRDYMDTAGPESVRRTTIERAEFRGYTDNERQGSGWKTTMEKADAEAKDRIGKGGRQ